jgi:hypothetical protein
MSEQEPKDYGRLIGFVEWKFGSYGHHKCGFPKCKNPVRFGLPPKNPKDETVFFCLNHFLEVWKGIRKKFDKP